MENDEKKDLNLDTAMPNSKNYNPALRNPVSDEQLAKDSEKTEKDDKIAELEAKLHKACQHIATVTKDDLQAVLNKFHPPAKVK
jgi:hypothetical protein